MISSLTFILQLNINSRYNHLAIPDEEPGHTTALFQVLYKSFNTLRSNPKKELFLDVYVIFIFHAITTDNSGHCPYWQIYSMFSSKIEVTRTGASSSGTALKSQPNFLLTFSSNFIALVWTQKYQLFVFKPSKKRWLNGLQRCHSIQLFSVVEPVTYWYGSGSGQDNGHWILDRMLKRYFVSYWSAF